MLLDEGRIVEFDKCVEMFSNINEPLTTSPGLRYYCVTRRPSFMHCARPLGNQSSRCSRKWRVFRYPELCETICYTIFSNDKVPTDVYCNTGVGRGQCIAALAHPSCTGLVLPSPKESPGRLSRCISPIAQFRERCCYTHSSCAVKVCTLYVLHPN